MARVRINRNSFGAGVLSKRAQANSSSEMYNYGLTMCRNMIVDVLGGAYKRQGSRFVAELLSDRVKLVEFLYAPGRSCIVMFAEDGIRFYEYISSSNRVRDDKVGYTEQNKLTYEDFQNLKYFQMENKLYFYVDSKKCFWSIQREPKTEFKFEVTPGYKFKPEPKAPYTPTMLLRVTKQAGSFKLETLDEEGHEEPGIFTAEDVDRKISFKFRKEVSSERANIYWPEVKINAVENGIVTNATLTAGSTKEVFSEESLKTREWFISAIGEKGRLGNPSALTMFQGRLYMGKDTYVFASKRTEWPFCFAYGAEEDDGFVQRVTSGNMGDILWMYPIEKMIIGTADGVYLVGNTAQFAEALTNYNFVSIKIGSMGCSSLPPIDAEGCVVFVGTDNRSVHELEITQDGGYVISQINRLSEDLAKTGIIDHAWQQYPRKTYWVVTQDGSLVCCSYDKGSGIHAWHDHVLGGKNAFVLQIETTKESNTDLLWMIVRREVNGKAKVFLEFFAPPFDPVEEDEFEQRYTDSGVMVQQKCTIKDIVNANSFHVNIEYDEQFEILMKYMDTGYGHLLVAFDSLSKIYDNPDLSYYRLSRNGFFISAYGNGFTLSAKNRTKMEQAVYLFETFVGITKIENKTDISGANVVFVQSSVPELLSKLSNNNEVLIFKNTGYTNLDNRPFRIYNPSAAGFFLAGMNGYPINLKLEGNFNSNGTKLYIGKRELPTGITCKDGYVEFGENVFDEAVDKAVLHTARFSRIKGATKYNGHDYSLKLTNIDADKSRYQYGLYHNVKDPEGLEYVAASYGYGAYDKLLEVNGYAYFYFKKISKNVIKHLIGQTVCYTINGNFPDARFFELTEDKFDEDGNFVLAQESAATDFGLPYTCELETTPLAGGSMFGSSEGSVGTQTEVVLILYASLGGQFGPYAPKDSNEEKLILEDIKYPWQDTVGKERQLESSSIRVPIQNNKDVTLRQVYLRQEEPLSFNVLSIVQDVVVSDG